MQTRALRITPLMLIGVAAAAAACSSPPDHQAERATFFIEDPVEEVGDNALARAERAAGWQLLFDGASLQGWRGLGRDSVPSVHWAIEDGAIKKVPRAEVPAGRDGRRAEGGDLMTSATYGDFDLSFEWKVAEGGAGAVVYNVSEVLSITRPPSHSAVGLEYPLLDDARHREGRTALRRTADLAQIVAAGEGRVLRPAGEWNHSRVVLKGSYGGHWLNGERVLTYDLDTPFTRSLFQQSELHGIPELIDRRRGHIVLRDRGEAIWFRNLKILELPGGTR
jgi:hypothetical protein